ncbi:flavodoxin domain-containing protein [Streptomyces sp. NRRL B-1347]|uniref:flavodoxin domain-containing protein n=1 Tax=Streptomyces sp. NRRL B-1347 TaxID=1476877 RepID=UPI0004C73A79|nr:flavodoxin domain-containing protein [Streptomyces sp. NRRL B-1347]
MAVLVGYASAHGCTRYVAKRIAARLTEHDLTADVRALRPHRENGAYDAFVLGSAIHQASWLPEAQGYLRHHTSLLIRYLVRLFRTGVAHVTGRTARVGVIPPRQLSRYHRVLEPRGYHLFAGVVERSHYDFLGRLVFRALGGRYDDYRDWRNHTKGAPGSEDPVGGAGRSVR